LRCHVGGKEKTEGDRIEGESTNYQKTDATV